MNAMAVFFDLEVWRLKRVCGEISGSAHFPGSEIFSPIN